VRVVVDASIIMDAFTTTLGSDANRRSLSLLQAIMAGEVQALAPDHFTIECANAGRKYQQRNRDAITMRDTLQFFNRMKEFPIQQCTMVLDSHLCASWAYAFNSSAYDAVYVELARMLDAQVATSDKGMRAACLNFKVPLWEPPAL
jgi:predicted nucleic acid-binding protein